MLFINFANDGIFDKCLDFLDIFSRKLSFRENANISIFPK